MRKEMAIIEEEVPYHFSIPEPKERGRTWKLPLASRHFDIDRYILIQSSKVVYT